MTDWFLCYVSSCVLSYTVLEQLRCFTSSVWVRIRKVRYVIILWTSVMRCLDYLFTTFMLYATQRPLGGLMCVRRGLDVWTNWNFWCYLHWWSGGRKRAMKEIVWDMLCYSNVHVTLHRMAVADVSKQYGACIFRTKYSSLFWLLGLDWKALRSFEILLTI